LWTGGRVTLVSIFSQTEFGRFVHQRYPLLPLYPVLILHYPHPAIKLAANVFSLLLVRYNAENKLGKTDDYCGV
jgi:hypothetical protein